MYSGVPRPRTDSRCPRISTSARPSVMRCLLDPLARVGTRRRRPARGPSQPLDPGKILQDALDLTQQLASLVEQPTLLRLESPDRAEAGPEALRLGGEVGDPRLEPPAIRSQLRVLRAERADQLDRALHVLLEKSQALLHIVAHEEPFPLPAPSEPSGPRTSAPSSARSRSTTSACARLTSASVSVRSPAW